tara:strand:- start:1602 stop:1883 length:282 start_codon:yes stop_codon:yes gene_type:complete
MSKKHDYNEEMQDLIFTSAGDFIGMQEKEEEEHNYCTTRGLGWAFLIIALFMLGVPIIMLMAMVGLDEYARYCNLNIMPCFTNTINFLREVLN